MNQHKNQETVPLRIGILGAARIAPAALILPARQVTGVEVVSVAARELAKAQAFAAAHHIPQTHASYAALIADPTIDAIYNPLPNSLHAEWSICALQAGKHVLCEKPLANNASEAQAMAAAAQASGRLLMEAFHYRYHPLTLRIKEIVESGELGRIRHLEAHFCIPLYRRHDIRWDYALGGGALMDLGCYTVNLLRYLAGAEPTVIRAQAKVRAPQVDRWMAAELRFPNGISARMTNSFFSAVLLRVSARVVGEAGELRVINFVLPQLWHRLTVQSGQGKRVEHFPGESSYVHQLRAFVAFVRQGTPCPTDAADGVANMRVIDAIYEKAGLQRRGEQSTKAF